MALMGHALFAKQDVYDKLKGDFDNLQDPFIQEMRRYYPFFPMLPAIAVRDVEINGYQIPKDSWVVLDLSGTNHDERTIASPKQFDIRSEERRVGKETRSRTTPATKKKKQTSPDGRSYTRI